MIPVSRQPTDINHNSETQQINPHCILYTLRLWSSLLGPLWQIPSN